MKKDADMKKKFSKSEKGLGLIEILIATAIMILVLGGTIKVFTYQQSLIRDENDTAKVRAKGRLAVKRIAKEVRMAGFGLPPGLGLDPDMAPLPATVDSLSFRSNPDGTRTMMDPNSGGAPQNATSITIVPGVAFKKDDQVALFNPSDPNGEVYDLVTLTHDVPTSATTMKFFPGLKLAYTFFSNAKAAPINKYSNYTIFQDGAQIKKTINDDVTIPIINDLELNPNGLVFDFNGATDTADVVRIGITLNMLDPNNPNATMEFHTDVTLRNTRT